MPIVTKLPEDLKIPVLLLALWAKTCPLYDDPVMYIYFPSVRNILTLTNTCVSSVDIKNALSLNIMHDLFILCQAVVSYINPYMSKEPINRLFKHPLECQRPIYRLCIKRRSSIDVTVYMTSPVE